MGDLSPDLVHDTTAAINLYELSNRVTTEDTNLGESLALLEEPVFSGYASTSNRPIL